MYLWSIISLDRHPPHPIVFMFSSDAQFLPEIVRALCYTISTSITQCVVLGTHRKDAREDFAERDFHGTGSKFSEAPMTINVLEEEESTL